MSHLQTAVDPAKTLLFELDSKVLPLVLDSDFDRYFNFFSLEFLSNSSCFREIALSESACSTEYKSIINEVMINNDNSNDTTDDDETPEVTLTRLCWYVSRLPQTCHWSCHLVFYCCSGYGKFVKCSYRHVVRVPTCSTGSTHFIQEYLKRNIGTPLLVSIKSIRHHHILH